MTADQTEKRFIRRIRTLLVSLPYDLKVLIEAVSDGDLPNEARELAAGAAVYCLSSADSLPDASELLGYVDDVLVVRLSLRRLLEVGGEGAAGYPERYPEQYEGLEEDLQLMESYLGEVIPWLATRLEKALPRLRYKGKSVRTFVQDEDASEFLYEEGLGFTTNYDVEDEAAAKLQSGRPVIEAYRRRMAEESRSIG